MNSKNKIVIATGGTGGHVFPSISLGNFLTDYYNIEISNFIYLDADVIY